MGGVACEFGFDFIVAKSQPRVVLLLEVLAAFFGLITGVGFIIDMVPTVKYDMNPGIYVAFGSIITALTTTASVKREEGSGED